MKKVAKIICLISLTVTSTTFPTPTFTEIGAISGAIIGAGIGAGKGAISAACHAKYSSRNENYVDHSYAARVGACHSIQGVLFGASLGAATAVLLQNVNTKGTITKSDVVVGTSILALAMAIKEGPWLMGW